MNAPTLVIRREAAADRQAIHALHRVAFGGEGEAKLVDALRADGAVVLSLVAEEDSYIVGHVLYSRLTLDPPSNGALSLAPVAVAPERQKRGIGSRLIEEAHRMLAASGEKIVFVLGDPAFYGRFGFSAAAAKPFRTPYDGEYMQVLALAPDAPKSGTALYPAAFAGLE
jgi:putative acetyltransferase